MLRGFVSSIILILLSGMILASGSFYLGTKYNESKNKQEPLSKQGNIKQDNTSQETTETPSNEFVEKSRIKKIKADISWEEEEFKYKLINVYLAPTLQDIEKYKSTFPSTTKIDNMSFLVAEVSVLNSSNYATGDFNKRVVPAANYFRLKTESGIIAPIYGNYRWLSPQETGEVLVIFPVEKNQSRFTLNVGLLVEPTVLEVNFEKSNVDEFNGYFFIEKGFVSEVKISN